jgi:hypothetical protein
MSKLNILIICSLLIVTGCEKDNYSLPENPFLVDKIYDYNNNLVGDYYYNDYNELKKVIFTDPINDRRIDYLFEYKNHKVEYIKYVEYGQSQFDHDIKVIYNKKGQIIRKEIYKNDQFVSYQNYSYLTDGKLKCLSDDDGNENYFFQYNDSNNVVQVKWNYVDTWFNFGDTIEMTRNFKYDNNPKPDFSINYIFFIELLPWFGTEATLEKSISSNNMIEYIGGTRWIYTYNSDSLPETIETKWKGIETFDPMILRIKYKKIK